MRPPLQVLITIDTEVWPKDPARFRADPRADIRRDVFGASERGEFGIEYTMDVLERHGLTGVFLVESLFADAVGIAPLAEIVETVQSRGHEVQLHVHPEWLAWTPKPALPGKTGRYLKDFSEAEQMVLIGRALANLKLAGAPQVCAFRAGNYGADTATLRALAKLGIAFDTSYNPSFLGKACAIETVEPLLQPQIVDGVCEVPIATFRDYPRHRRHAQVCACSFREMRSALLRAYRQGWRTFVIVSHSFELLRRREQVLPPLPDRVVIARFEALCRVIAENPQMFRASGLSQLDADEITQPLDGARMIEIDSPLLLTTMRYVEQAGRHLQQ